MTNESSNKNAIGIICIIIGTVIFMIFAGGFVMQIIGSLIGIILINYGLEVIGLPRLQDLFFHFTSQLNHKFKR